MKLGLNKNITGTLDKKEPNQTWPNPRTSTSTHHNQKEGDNKINQSPNRNQVNESRREKTREGASFANVLPSNQKAPNVVETNIKATRGGALWWGFLFFLSFFFYDMNRTIWSMADAYRRQPFARLRTNQLCDVIGRRNGVAIMDQMINRTINPSNSESN